MKDLEDFHATTEFRRPSRILYHAGFTDDLLRRVIEHIGTENIGQYYGFYATCRVRCTRQLLNLKSALMSTRHTKRTITEAAERSAST